MMEKMDKKQKSLLKKNIDKMSKSDEQFIILIFKDKDGSDNITQYCWNMPEDKIALYLMKALKYRS